MMLNVELVYDSTAGVIAQNEDKVWCVAFVDLFGGRRRC